MNISRTQTDKLVVGTNAVSYTAPDTSPTGTAVLNGPVFVGFPLSSPNAPATLNVARLQPPQNPLDPQPVIDPNLAILTDGNVTIKGDDRTANGLSVQGGSSQYKLFVGGNAEFDHPNIGDLSERFNTADGRPKPFDIKHPTKGEGHRLRYACIEGPEVGVYYRGRLKGSNIIELPYYWKDLVHEDSITVQLQPIGDRHFHLNVVSFDNKEIIIKEADDKPIDCFYHVYAERKDINPLIVEYEGKKCSDYPDPNHHSINESERNYNDEKYRGDRNTITK